MKTSDPGVYSFWRLTAILLVLAYLSGCNMIAVEPTVNPNAVGDGDTGNFDVQILEPANGAFVTNGNANGFRVSGSCDSGASIKIEIRNRSTNALGGSENTMCQNESFAVSFASLASLADGNYKIQATAVSPGGVTDTDLISVVRSQLGTTITASSLVDASGQSLGSLTKAVVVYVKVEATNASQIALFNNGSCVGTSQWQNYVTRISRPIYSLNGVNVYSAKVKTSTGTESACSSSLSVRHDGIVPTVSITSFPEQVSTVPVANLTVDLQNLARVPVSGLCSTQDNGREVTFMIGTSIIPSVGDPILCSVLTPGQAGNFSGNLDLRTKYPLSTRVQLANQPLVAKLVDQAGNIGLSQSRLFNIDTLPPGDYSGQTPVEGVGVITGTSGGTLITSTSAVTIALTSMNSHEVYVTNTPGCTTGGDWRPMATSSNLAWIGDMVPPPLRVFFKFRDAARNETSCLSDSIDTTGTALLDIDPFGIGTAPNRKVGATAIPSLFFSGSCNKSGRNVAVEVKKISNGYRNLYTAFCAGDGGANPEERPGVWSTEAQNVDDQPVGLGIMGTANVDGDWRVSATYTDSSGNTDVAIENFKIDTTPPAFGGSPEFSVAPANLVSELKFSLRIAASRPAAIRVSADCAVEQANSYTSPLGSQANLRWDPIAAGATTVRFRLPPSLSDLALRGITEDTYLGVVLIDDAQNESSCVTLPLKLGEYVDTTGPEISVTSITNWASGAPMPVALNEDFIVIRGRCAGVRRPDGSAGQVTLSIPYQFNEQGVPVASVPGTANCTLAGDFTFAKQSIGSLPRDAALKTYVIKITGKDSVGNDPVPEPEFPLQLIGTPPAVVPEPAPEPTP